MRIGFLGLGKLGGAVALTMAFKGHDVIGYDINQKVMTYKPRKFKEAGPDGKGNMNDLLGEPWIKEKLKFGTLEQVADHAEILFICTQTSHAPEYEGTTRLLNESKDFDYTYLVAAVETLSEIIEKDTVIAIISTCLPGTMEECIKPLLNKYMHLVYSPMTPAMGTVMNDFLTSEFFLVGVENEQAAQKIEEFYNTIAPATPICKMSVESAELTKVIYNLFITLKISYSNTIMEICHKIPKANCDDVTNALSFATKRLISSAYMKAGMQDGGPCHPRDLIAMWNLGERLDLSYNIFFELAQCREKQTQWLCELISDYYWKNEKFDKVFILGYSFKPESNITVGSPAILCENILKEMGIPVTKYDPFVDEHPRHDWWEAPGELILIGTKHEIFKQWKFPRGSVVIDPFRSLVDQDGVEIVRVGE